MEQEPEGIFTRSQDQRPSGLTGARAQLLLSCKPPPLQGRHKNQVQEHKVSGVHFLQDAAPVPGANGASRETIKHRHCNAHAQSLQKDCVPRGTQVQEGHQMPRVSQSPKSNAQQRASPARASSPSWASQTRMAISFSSEVASVAASHLRRGRC